MALSATGIGSGLDIEGLVSQLMAAERAPLERALFRREAKLTSDISSLGAFKSSLYDLRSSLTQIHDPTTYQRRNATSSDSEKVTASASNGSALGSYEVTVSSLATPQSLAVRSEFSSSSEAVGTGTLTFTFGATAYTKHASDNTSDTYDGFVAKSGVSSKTITVDSTNNTLAGLRDAVNNADIGVSAAIVNDGTSYRLLFSSETTGAENAFKIDVDDTGDSNDTDGSGLSRLAFNATAGVANVYQTVAAVDATYTVNGLSLASDSNSVTDVVDGVTLNLKKVTSTAETVTVSDNATAVTSAIKRFVDGYNKYLDTLSQLTGYNADTGVGGPLQGDFSARTIASRIRSDLTNQASGFVGAFGSLSEIGITTTASGALSINDSELASALAENYADVEGTLARAARASSGSSLSNFSFTDSVTKGAYEIAVSSLATSGKLAATVPSAGFPITLDSATDAFVITVDGTASGTVTLTNQSYANLSAIATEIQTKINADATLRAAGKGVTVSVSGDNVEIRSNSVGSTSTIALVNAGTDSTITALGLALATTTGGTDLVGTINGIAGVAAGNRLSGASGTAAAGLSFDVGSTAGGTVTISDGVIDQLDTYLGEILGIDNPLDSRISSMQKQALSIGDERAQLDRRMAALEARTRKQFNAMDALLNQLNGTGKFVADQLANIPVPGANKK